MITNERQYKITKNQLEAFEQAHAEALTEGAGAWCAPAYPPGDAGGTGQSDRRPS
jgi:hypothetical protein